MLMFHLHSADQVTSKLMHHQLVKPNFPCRAKLSHLQVEMHYIHVPLKTFFF
jgi:hypothetical protein